MKSVTYVPRIFCYLCSRSLQNSPYVFTDGDDKRFKDVKRFFFASILKKAGIKDFRFHDLRYTFASQLVMAGVDITIIKELLNHKGTSKNALFPR